MREHNLQLFAPLWQRIEADVARPSTREREILICGGLGHAVPSAAQVIRLSGRSARELGYDLLRRCQMRATNVQAGPEWQIATCDPVFAQGAAALLRSVAQEGTDLRAQVILISPDCANVMERLATCPTGAFVDLRGAFPLVRRFVPITPQTGPLWRSGGRYVVSGAPGGVGRLLLADMAARGTDVQVLGMGRSEPDPTEIAAWRAKGLRLDHVLCDVADGSQVARAVGDWRDQGGPVTGVLHLAGVTRDALLHNKREADVQAVLAPKLDGFAALDAATTEDRLDFFVAFSSLAGITGNEGQSDYALANALMDAEVGLRAEAVRRGQRHGRTLSVNWPFWADGGMTIAATGQAALQSAGLFPMTSVQGLSALGQALASDADQVAVACGSMQDVAAHLNADPATDSAPRHGPAASAGPGLAPVAPLTALIAEVTKRDPDLIDPEDPFAVYGIDSLMVVEICHRLRPVFGDLPRALLFEHRTVAALAAHLAERDPEACARWTGEAGIAPSVKPVPAQPAVRPPRRADDDIAIIGMSGRFPEADNIDQFWANLRDGKDCIGTCPPDRWAQQGFFHPTREAALAQGGSYSNSGGFIRDFAGFDPLFFNIAPRDALEMDPQERLFLQAAWHALEDAGLTRAQLRARFENRVGVFAGVTKSDHTRLGPRRHADGSVLHARSSFSSIANKVSFFLDLSGPSLPVDTMCSASLTAVHMACEALRDGRCDMALVGGVNLYQHPSSYAELCRSGMLSTDGRCRSFGAGGDGFVPGEGVGCLVLVPLAQARAAKDRIDAVIAASAVNHGGAANGYTVPNPAAQRALVRTVLDEAGVDGSAIGYVEAHGTGTALGDPIEVEALTGALATDAPRSDRCALGSVKSNIGHLEAAAGVAGVIKTVLQLRDGWLAPTLHAAQTNPDIDFSETPFELVQSGRVWGGPRMATVSSFGAGGANACVLLKAPEAAAVPTRKLATGPDLAVLSARTDVALRRQVAALAAWLRDGGQAVSTAPAEAVARLLGVDPGEVPTDVPLGELGLTADELRGLAQAHTVTLATCVKDMGSSENAVRPVDLGALCQTLRGGREQFAHRAAFVTTSVADLLQQLEAWPDDNAALRGEVTASKVDLRRLNEDPDVRTALAELVHNRDLTRIAGLWLQGLEIDWSALASHSPPLSLPGYSFESRRMWIGDLDPAEPTSARPVPQTNSDRGQPIMTGTQIETPQPTPARHSVVEIADRVREVFLRVMDLEPGDISDTQPFADYGLDSILGGRFVQAINAALGTDLSQAAIFDHATIRRLAAHVQPLVPETAPVATVNRSETPVLAPVQPAQTATPRLTDEPIAIVGMSGRYPGAETLERFWQRLEADDEMLTPVTRWSLPESVTCRRGGFLDGIAEFDALFFNISGTEARHMDPQQRIFLEECWHALEHAGHAGTGISGRNCGVYVGCCAGDYQDLFPGKPTAQSLWGNMASVIPARIAYYLDLKGPALALDTSCSSSLVAIHAACAALRSGEVDMALAGGVFVQATPKLYLAAGKAGMLSPNGRCHSFDARADGFVPGEGAGVLVLRPLSAALADGDTVHAVIAGSAINHDGMTNGITAPSSTSQAALMRGLYDRAGIDPAQVQLLEAHGTGTQLGDPIEFEALRAVFGSEGEGHCALSSVKTAIGHGQFAAGVAGVHKAALALAHDRLPGSRNFRSVNDKIAMRGSPFRVVTRTEPWPRVPGRLAAISSFGASGTNAHVLLADAPEQGQGVYQSDRYPVLLSARSPEALRGLAEALADWCDTGPDAALGDVAFTLMTGRAHLEHRTGFVVHDLGDLAAALRGWLSGGSATAASEDRSEAGRALAAYLDGADPDPLVFDGDRPRRRPLPRTHFERDVYWVDEHAPQDKPAGEPLFSVTREEGNLFRVRIDPDGVLMANHRVAGMPILPGLTVPAIAHKAWLASGVQAGPVEIRDLTWLLPVDGAALTDLTLSLSRRADGADFVLCSDGRTHAQGYIGPVAGALPPALTDPGAGEAISPQECEAALCKGSVIHGAELLAITGGTRAGDRARVSLERPSATPLALDPVMLDAAVQGSVVFAEAEAPATVPYSVARIVMNSGCSDRMTALLSAPKVSSDGTRTGLDVDLFCKGEAVPAVQMRGITARPLRRNSGATEPAVDVPSSVLSVSVPVWRKVTPDTVAFDPGHVVVLGASAEHMARVSRVWPTARSVSTPQEIGETPDTIVLMVPDSGPVSPQDVISTAKALTHDALDLIRTVVAQGGETRALNWLICTEASLSTGRGEAGQGIGAGLVGLFGSMAREYPHWRVRIADAETLDDLPLAELAALPGMGDAPVFARRSGLWLEQGLNRMPEGLPGQDASQTAGGVHVIVGGAGGVGRIWSEHLTRTAGAQVVWIGRRAPDDDIRAEQDRIGRLGPRPVYIQADARNPEALARARAQILSDFGGIDLLAHSAITLADATLARMQPDVLEDALSAKVDTTVNMLNVFAGDVRRAVVFFSSVQSFARMPGQGNYAAGCTFSDHFARMAGARLDVPIRIVNWGYWDQAGIVATDEYRDRMAQVGLAGLDVGAAMQALDAVIDQDLAQVALASLDEGGTLTGQRADVQTVFAPAVPDMRKAMQLPPQAPAVNEISSVVGRQMDRFDTQMAGLVAVALADVGVLTASGLTDAVPKGAPPIYARWLDETRRALHRDGILDAEGHVVAIALPTRPEAERAWDNAVAAWRTSPDLGPHVALAEAMLRALPEILAGSVEATSVMFPGGALDLVSGVYNGNRVVDYFNKVLCDVLENAVRQRIAEDPDVRLRLIEVGAGTGGTANRVFDRLAPYAANIVEYRYTDLSRSFLIHAKQSFGPRAPYLETALFDVGKSPDDQGLATGRYDIAIATNVLHATPDVLTSLRNVKATLARGGLILLNELTENVLFSHVTFGLLDGWWAYDDADLRLEGTPALSPEMWRAALEAESFDTVSFPTPEGRVLGQQIIAARSDGLIHRVSMARGAVPVAATVETAAPKVTVPLATSDPAPETETAEAGLSRDTAMDAVRSMIAEAIDIPAARIADEVSLARYGVDSILILQIVANMRDAFPQISSTLLFEMDTVAALTDHLIESAPARMQALLGAQAPAPAKAASPPEPHVANAAEPAVPPAEPSPPTIAEVSKSAPAGDEDRAIAIIGLSGRYAGAPDLDAFWQVLSEGRDCVTDRPGDGRPWPVEQGQTLPAGYMDGVDRFDPLFFQIAPADAERMDPQERLFLQAAHNAIEASGYDPERFGRNQRVGVYAGVMNGHYPTRAAFWSVANRVSYLFDFTGPSLSVDTACSSSLTALHLAVEGLRDGRCDVALAGGVNVIAHPRHLNTLRDLGMLAPGGRARAFGADADGMVSGEGVGVAVLKPLHKALADGDHIHGVLLGSALNSGGRTRSYTAPSPKAHADVISSALRDARVEPSQVSLIEAHGTGTALGDPVEIAGLNRALDGAKSVRVSSVKSNIGHCESAAGIAGVTKVLLQMQNRQVVPSLHVQHLNPELDLSSGMIEIVREPQPWTAQRRIAGVSSFGAGGANAHVILAEAPEQTARRAVDGPQLVVLSANDARGLSDRARDLAQALGGVDAPLGDLAYTLQTGRTPMRHRLAFVASSAEEARARLKDYAEGRESGVEVTAETRPEEGLTDLLRRWAGSGDWARIAELWLRGFVIDWEDLWIGKDVRRIPLPGYPFAAESYWLTEPDAAPATAVPVATPKTVMPEDEPEDALLTAQAHLVRTVSETLKIAAERLDLDAPLDGYGLDSVMVLRLSDRLEARYGALPSTLFYQFRTLRALAEHLSGLSPVVAEQPAASVAEAVAHAPAITAAQPREQLETDRTHDIAIIGVAGRYPGAPDLQSFWELLKDGRDAITEIPRDRWDHDPYYSPTRAPGKTRSRWGGFLDNVDAFDAPFFGILPADAEQADPQERLFVETAYHAVQNAGHTPGSLRAGGAVGVFTGVMYEDYQLWGVEETLQGTPVALSGSPASIANRVSWLFDFRGPSLAVDSMCSSSLSALHLAVRAIRAGECASAVAGGVNLTLHPNKYLMMGRGGFESTTGRCTSFGAGGDGYVPSEGVGAVVLKPLAQALADGDPVWAVIKGSALNHGGRSNGYTVPDPVAQAEVISAALRDGGVAPETLSYVEAHGTGTALGDPIEVAGLSTALHGNASCALGSVKSNIGHCESAAGIAGLTKVLMQMRHRQIVPSLHSSTLNPHLDLAQTAFHVPQALEDWTGTGALRAGISSFGAGGSNVHLVVEEAPSRVMRRDSGRQVPLILSARTDTQLRQMGRDLAAHLEGTEDALDDVAYTLQAGREVLPKRTGFVAADRPSAIAGLRALSEGRMPASVADDPAAACLTAWLSGEPVDWDAFWPEQRQRIALPAYPFERHSYWGVPRKTTPATASGDTRTSFDVIWVERDRIEDQPDPQRRCVMTVGLPAPDDADATCIAPELPSDATQAMAVLAAFIGRVQEVCRGPERADMVQIMLPSDAGSELVAALAGAVGAVAQDVPGCRVQLVQAPVDAPARALAQEARCSDRVIRHQAGRRQVRRITRADTVAGAPFWPSDGVVVISGGAGGLGRILARHAMAQGAHVALLGRSAKPEGLEDLQAAHPGRLTYLSVDICNGPALARALEGVRAEGKAIRAVIHAAGLLRDASVLRKSPQDAMHVASVKIAGLEMLDAATAQDPLEFFLCASSLAGLTGNAGQVDYAFANGWLDGEMAARAERGGRGRSLSVNWPFWSGGGMTLSDAARRAMQRDYGLVAMPDAEGIAALGEALASQATQRIVTFGRAEVIEQRLDGGAVEAARSMPVVRAPAMDDAPDLTAQTDSPADILEGLLDLVAEVLRIDPGEVAPDHPMVDYGFDSISFTDLADRCSTRFAAAVTPDVFLSFSTLTEVAEHLATLLPSRIPPQSPAAPLPVLTEDRSAPAIHGTDNPVSDLVAICGMSAAFPGAPDIETFWRNLKAGRDAISEIPSDRWDWRAYDGDPGTEPGKTDVSWGGFMSGLADFDPMFFGISPRDAELMDPHQRLLMTHIWHAIETAGLSPQALAGTDTAVFLATSASDYAALAAQHGIILEQRTANGMVGSIAPNRISALLNLHGPSEPVETACSSSLVALHRAVEAIRSGAPAAIIGAVNTILTPNAHISFARSGMLSRTGRCKAFSDTADGYVRSEAVGAMLLRPLDAALDADEPVLGVIRATGINHGGRSGSLFAPNAEAQSAVIAKALHLSGLDPRDITAIEAHGTGTPLGDPVEFEGLRRGFEAARIRRGATGTRDGRPHRCAVSSVKTHIGHTEMAAGFAGLVKMVLQMREGTLIGDLHRDRINSRINLADGPFHLVDGTQDWPRLTDAAGNAVPRRAGVSSFGFGGVNAHVVLEEAPQPTRQPAREIPAPELVVLSAMSEDRLRQSVVDLRAWLDSPASEGATLAEIAHTLQTGRVAQRQRLALIAKDRGDLRRKMDRWLTDPAWDGVFGGKAARRDPPSAPAHDAALDVVARAWVGGATPDWVSRRQGGSVPRRISLPTSAMRMAQHWIIPGKTVPSAVAGETAAVRSGFLGQPVIDGERQTYPVFLDEQVFFLRDHKVNGEPVLPGAAHLELARAALAAQAGHDDCLPLTLHDVTLERMVGRAALAAGLRVVVQPFADRMTFEITSGEGAARQVHSRGTASRKASGPASLPLDQLRAQPLQELTPETFYQAFSGLGLDYGASHRAIRSAEARSDLVLTRVSQSLPPETLGPDMVLPPNMVDAALQSTLGLGLIDGAGPLTPAVPVRLTEVVVRAPIGRDAVVVVQSDSAAGRRGVDVAICDAEGRVQVALNGFVTAPLPAARTQTHLLRPCWRAAGPGVPLSLTRHVVFDLTAKGLEAAETPVEAHVLRFAPDEAQDALLTVLRALRDQVTALPRSKQGAGAAIQVLVDDADAPLSRALAGALRSLRIEWPALTAQVVAFGTHATSSRLRDALAQGGESLVREGAELFCLGVEELIADRQTCPWHDDGIYLLSGGAGGLGRILAHDIAARANNPTVVLLGRSLASPDTEDLLAALEALGAKAEYHAVDVTRHEQVSACVSDVTRRLGPLTGVIHAAGIALDAWLTDKSDDVMAQVLEPKIAGARALDLATRNAPLELFLCASSIAAVFGNQGQVDYALANGWLDGFAATRNALQREGKRAGRAVSVNWPLWRDGGMRVDPATERQLRTRFGVVPMPTRDGLAALDQAWASGLDQVVVLHGESEKLRQWVQFDGTEPTASPAPPLSAAPPPAATAIPRTGPNQEAVTAELSAIVADLSSISVGDIDPEADFAEYGLDSIRMTELAAQVSEAFGVTLSPTALFEFPTVEALARHTAQLAASLRPKVEVSPEPVARPVVQPGAGIVEELTAMVADLVKLPISDIDPSEELSEYALDSIAFTELAGQVSARYGIDVSPAAFYALPTLEAISVHIASETLQPAVPGPSNDVTPEPTQSVYAKESTPTPQPHLTAKPKGAATEGFAIIGMTGAFPGAPDLERFWQNLVEGRDVISRPPAARWDWQAIDGDPRVEQGRCNVHWGGFMEGLDRFDPEFFGISAGEAEVMDPQQRLLMTHVWRVLESSGYAPRSLSGSRTGLFVGMSASSYSGMVAKAGRDIDPRWVTGNVASVGPNRISHLLDLQGPSEPVETACSSSLVALHRGLESLRSGESDMVIAGGVNIMPDETLHVAFAAAGMLAQDGRCRSFAEGASGYVRGEGIGLVAVKRLADAEADGDEILAVIRASGVRHAGRAVSLTAPNPASQAALIAEVQHRAGVDPRQITCIEAHGTGTALGDPIEIDALKTAFGQGPHGPGEPAHCAISALKSHIGHLELAAGVAGLIKLVLQMRHGVLAGNLHCEQVNPHIRLDGSPFYIVRKTIDWPRQLDAAGQEQPRLAGLSSFGFGGVNAHLVLEEYPAQASPEPPADAAAILISARTPEQLAAAVVDLRDWAAERNGDAALLHRVAHTLQVGRDRMACRLGFVAGDWSRLVATLERLAGGETPPGVERNASGDAQVAGVLDDDDLASVVAGWAARGDLARMVKGWVAGFGIDWATVRQGPAPRRIALPTYPFAEDRYWIRTSGKQPAPVPVAKPEPAPLPPKGTADEGIADLVTGTLAEFLAVPAENLTPDTRFQDVGVDSIGLLTLSSRVAARLPGLNLDAYGSRMLEAPTLGAFCAVLDQANGTAAAPVTSGSALAEPASPDPQHPDNVPAVDRSASQNGTVRLDMYGSSLKADPLDLVIARLHLVSRSPLSAEAELVVNEAHPFFFDHPLDHVSGMHLCEAMCQLTRAVHAFRHRLEGPGIFHLVDLRFEFPNVCSKTVPALVQTELKQDGPEAVYAARVVQDGRVVAEAQLVCSDRPVSELVPGKAPGGGRRTDRRWVNKTNPANVLLAGLRAVNDGLEARLSIHPQASFFADAATGTLDAIVLAEAARQLTRAAPRLLPATPAKDRTTKVEAPAIGLLKHLAVTLDAPLQREAPILLRTEHCAPVALGGAAMLALDGYLDCALTGARLGSFSTKVISVTESLKNSWDRQRHQADKP
ncbi:SDR family NAD(P)-dependent oxidoreductase [Antarctobacter jejuensis]|uniref:SDR family NAD(P)-dependent oxidoreductase n=1 Tax=Antarctobacter jejuensis TaxID=1439938 RepID=UPI003FD478BC